MYDVLQIIYLILRYYISFFDVLNVLFHFLDILR